ncbi:TPA: phage repressor protein CI [Salmonella enterica]|uniref:Phage repressor protein n=2 Tax=Enterobacteriaceae TaxID=543 RepID=A0A3U2P2P0_SALET|nr:phage repressor protein CI [Salmonella enterica]EAA3600561.1 phage repressor protein [Salmonella enterica subsp. enterica serovar Schwarzengrund]EBS6753067.1 phage repressor protein [Salmonella enterica subsp. enterica serovar Wangata]ECE1056509.1 phage repressor protein [Salmonella enterica subsp. enterica]ECE8600928.1 phage repressor protein [Salmonella enterica subsp. enterica serovar Javiana]ECE8872937.1 phage repressor protein [Salmonella enterica subsp. enterica serovar Poona]ECS3563
MNLQIEFSQGGAEVLDRVIQAYGFNTKLALAEHLDIASSSLANRYKRDFFPADIVVRCMAETGATLEWLATGQGRKFNDDELDIMKLPRKKIVDGKLYESGFLMLDKVTFLPGKPLPQNPICVIDNTMQYIVDQHFTEIYDDVWLVEVEGKTSVRTLTRIPVGKVRVSGVGMAFDCAIDDIVVIGRVVLTIS